MSRDRVDDDPGPQESASEAAVTVDRPADPERPPIWFSLPPGFTPLGDHLPEGLVETLTEGLSPAAAAALTDAVAGAERMLEAQRHSPLAFHAAGMHPREDGGADLSQLSAGTVAVSPAPTDALLLRIAQGEEAREETVSVQVREFPAGFAVVAERSVTVGEVEMRGIRTTFAHPDEAHLAVIDLASNAIDVWSDYRDVALGLLARTLSFEDPELARAEQEQRDAVASRLEDRLGSRPRKTSTTQDTDQEDDRG